MTCNAFTALMRRMLVVVAAAALVTYTRVAEADDSPADDATLKPMIRITWTRGPNLPQGFQDSDGGLLGRTLVTAGGFCDGRSVPGKEAKHPRGFLNKAWALDLERAASTWQPIPDFPGSPRQGLSAVRVGDALYYWGGFSYTAPFCFADGYRLSRAAGEWKWDRLPDMPRPLCAHGIAVVGSRIYVMGGADYDEQRFYTNGDRHKKHPGLGARLMSFDTEHPEAGWRELAACPGTPRWVHVTAAVGGKIYVIGGATGNDNPTGTYCTVVDNWQYDPATDKWTRLPDTSIATGNFPSEQVVFRDRYLLLVGGYQYKKVLNPDGTSRPVYGKAFKAIPGQEYYSDVLVYDTVANRFGRATPLPMNNNMPMAVVDGNTLHLLGGETGGCMFEGEVYAHHPDLHLIGTLHIVGE
jgi:N-acetylneuraminic acid mutarotase